LSLSKDIQLSKDIHQPGHNSTSKKTLLQSRARAQLRHTRLARAQLRHTRLARAQLRHTRLARAQLRVSESSNWDHILAPLLNDGEAPVCRWVTGASESSNRDHILAPLLTNG
jgi:hypothetical protein